MIAYLVAGKMINERESVLNIYFFSNTRLKLSNILKYFIYFDVILFCEVSIRRDTLSHIKLL